MGSRRPDRARLCAGWGNDIPEGAGRIGASIRTRAELFGSFIDAILCWANGAMQGREWRPLLSGFAIAPTVYAT